MRLLTGNFSLDPPVYFLLGQRFYRNDLFSGAVPPDYLQPGFADTKSLGQQGNHPGVGFAIRGRGSDAQPQCAVFKAVHPISGGFWLDTYL
ncbi:uncharacterized protein METZ01_LOCUS32914 [marine metagenome]|uniref:Uncharacterized protein n=1 Tax=marine metagenome TaxID=408172 RepID=A0A381QLY0_9ZZZZ